MTAPYQSQQEPQSEPTGQSANGQDGDWWLTFDVIVGRAIDCFAAIGVFAVVLCLMLWITR